MSLPESTASIWVYKPLALLFHEYGRRNRQWRNGSSNCKTALTRLMDSRSSSMSPLRKKRPRESDFQRSEIVQLSESEIIGVAGDPNLSWPHINLEKQKRKAEKGESISWSTIAQKAVRRMKAEREAER